MDYKLIGTRIKNTRKQIKKTQKDISEKAEISRSYYADVEAGRYAPSTDTLNKIANALQVSLSYLLEGEKTYSDIEILDKDKMTDIEEFYNADKVQRKENLRKTISELEKLGIELEEYDYSALDEIYKIIALTLIEKKELHNKTMSFLTHLISELNLKIYNDDINKEEYTKNQLKIIEMIKNM